MVDFIWWGERGGLDVYLNKLNYNYNFGVSPYH